MKKESLKLRRLINPSIKVGDLVRLVDGSGLSCQSIKYPLIVCSYPDLLGTHQPVEQLTGIVTKINQDFVVLNAIGDSCYLQDIEIHINRISFRTASQFVRNVNQ